MKPATISDVAAYAGVSTATVSHVINGTRFVSEPTVEKVQQAIKALSFTPNTSARSFKTGRKNIIGFIAPDIANSFFSVIIDEIETTLQKKGYHLIITNTKENKAKEINDLHTLSSGLVDGIILASTQEDYSDIANNLPKDFPLVLIDRIPRNSYADSVLPADRSSIQNGVTTLIRKGYQRIGYISGLKHLSTTQERLQAYQDTLKDNGLFIPELVKYANSMSQSAIRCAHELVDAGCDAIIASNNIMTIDTINYVQNHITNGGAPVCVLGYEANELYSWLPRPGFFVYPTREIGKIAGEQIINRITHPDSPLQEIIINSYFMPY